jgi:hypothetical protein
MGKDTKSRFGIHGTGFMALTGGIAAKKNIARVNIPRPGVAGFNLHS